MSLAGPVLVTGALGQDGFILCQHLRTQGARVVGIVRPRCGQVERRRILESDLGCRLIEIDLTEPKPLGELVATLKPSSIFHLAAAHHSAEKAAETPESWRAMSAVNLYAAETMARAVVESGIDCSLIYASSSQIWTASQPEHRVDETTPVQPSTFYGHTKIWASEMLRQYRQRFQLKASIAILFNHESPWRAPTFVTRKISMAAARAKRGDTSILELINIGARADWSAATDVISALILMAEAPEPDDYVVASGRSRSVADFLKAAYAHAGLNWQGLVKSGRDFAGPVLVGDPNKVSSRLGWRPSCAFEQLASGMVDADVARLAGEMAA